MAQHGLETASGAQAHWRLRACTTDFAGPFLELSLRHLCESGFRENRTSRLSGGRRPALRGASSDPTPVKAANKGARATAELPEGRASFGVAYIWTRDITFGWLMINIWHNFQYILFVWMFNNRRFKGGARSTGAFPFLHQPERTTVALSADLHRDYRGDLLGSVEGHRLAAVRGSVGDDRAVPDRQLSSLHRGCADLEGTRIRHGPRTGSRGLKGRWRTGHARWFCQDAVPPFELRGTSRGESLARSPAVRRDRACACPARPSSPSLTFPRENGFTSDSYAA